MNQRDYQQAAIDSVFNEWSENQSTIVVMPTGTGKTHVIAGVVGRMSPKRSIILAHREELIFQAREKIETATGLACEIEMADFSASTNLFNRTPVVVATVQTLISGVDRRRMERFDPKEFALVVCDECHHGTSPSYRKIFDYFTSRNPDIKILGVTACPDRCDEESLGQVFQTVAYDYEILDAIRDGWLVPVEQQMVSIAGLDYSHIRTTAGDLNGADLNAVMESESNLQGVASASVEIIKDRRSIVFNSSVKQAEVICNIFNRHRPGMAGWVCGSTPKPQRQQLLQDFQRGAVQVVCNCGVLTEGFDNPGVECIIMARPTKSRSLYAQMAGRSLRPLSGVVDGLENAAQRRSAILESPKKSALIVDFVGNSGKHKLMTTADILGGKVSDEAMELAVRKATQRGAPVDMTQELVDAEEELRKKKEEARLREEARKSRLLAKAKYVVTTINPFNVLDIVPVRSRGWDAGKVLSEKQRNILLKMGVNPDSIPYEQGRQLVVEQIRRWSSGLCSVKQASILKKYCWVLGHDRNTFKASSLTREEASKMIDQIAIKQNWKKN